MTATTTTTTSKTLPGKSEITNVLHREQMDIIGSADRREQLRKQYPDCELYLTSVVKDRRGFTVLIVEVRSK